jgi:hypothetical protein
MERWEIARRFTRKRDYSALRPVITAVDGGHGNPQQRGNPLHQRLCHAAVGLTAPLRSALSALVRNSVSAGSKPWLGQLAFVAAHTLKARSAAASSSACSARA